MQDRIVRTLLIAATLGSIGEGMLGPMLSIFTQKIGGSPLDIAASWSVYLIVTGLFMVVVGYYTDRIEAPEWLLVLGYLLNALHLWLHLGRIARPSFACTGWSWHRQRTGNPHLGCPLFSQHPQRTIRRTLGCRQRSGTYHHRHCHYDWQFAGLLYIVSCPLRDHGAPATGSNPGAKPSASQTSAK